MEERKAEQNKSRADACYEGTSDAVSTENNNKNYLLRSQINEVIEGVQGVNITQHSAQNSSQITRTIISAEGAITIDQRQNATSTIEVNRLTINQNSMST